MNTFRSAGVYELTHARAHSYSRLMCVTTAGDFAAACDQKVPPTPVLFCTAMVLHGVCFPAHYCQLGQRLMKVQLVPSQRK